MPFDFTIFFGKFLKTDFQSFSYFFLFQYCIQLLTNKNYLYSSLINLVCTDCYRTSPKSSGETSGRDHNYQSPVYTYTSSHQSTQATTPGTILYTNCYWKLLLHFHYNHTQNPSLPNKRVPDS